MNISINILILFWFPQRYFTISDSYQKGSPIFVLLGGQQNIADYDLIENFPIDIARNLTGYFLYLEHRYYGESIPQDGLTTENLRWLNVEQTLVDIYLTIDHARKTLVKDPLARVILVGGQFGGSLAVWFQHLYAGEATAAWASSAPLLAKIDYSDYFELVGNFWSRFGGDECYDRLKYGFLDIESLHRRGLLELLAKKYLICNIKRPGNDIRIFIGILASEFSNIAQKGR